MASHEISTLYYPSTSRPVRKLADDVLLGFAGRAENNLLHEFVLRRFTSHGPKIAAGLSQRILPEGTPVSLISVEDWSSKTAENGGPIAFMLASDLQVDGVIVAPIGSKAWGHASFTGGDGKAMQVELDQVRLQVGDTDVPLRSTPLRDRGPHWSIIVSKTPLRLPSCCTWAGTSRFRRPTKRYLLAATCGRSARVLQA